MYGRAKEGRALEGRSICPPVDADSIYNATETLPSRAPVAEWSSYATANSFSPNPELLSFFNWSLHQHLHRGLPHLGTCTSVCLTLAAHPPPVDGPALGASPWKTERLAWSPWCINGDEQGSGCSAMGVRCVAKW